MNYKKHWIWSSSKCWYYETACKDQTEAKLKKGFEDRMPEEIRKCYQNAHE